MSVFLQLKRCNYRSAALMHAGFMCENLRLHLAKDHADQSMNGHGGWSCALAEDDRNKSAISGRRFCVPARGRFQPIC